MNVLSLFDGMSCGRLALERAGIEVENYFASEIDKYAMQIAKKNWPDIQHIGDVIGVKAQDLPKIDLVMGGSPCQGFSFAGKQLNFDDPRSKLFFEFVRLLRECKPRYFLLENVAMKKEYQAVITEALGVEPIRINSALVSAQNRKRLYWTNIPGVRQPEDRGILLEDILEKDALLQSFRERRTEEAKRIRREVRKTTGKDHTPFRGKELVTRADKKFGCLTPSLNKDHLVLKVPVIKNHGELIYKPHKPQCLDANYHKGADNHGQCTGVVALRDKSQTILSTLYKENAKSMIKRKKWGLLAGRMVGRARVDGKRIDHKQSVAGIAKQEIEINKNPSKTNTLSTVLKDNPIRDTLDAKHWRKLTPTECERLQTVPDGYTEGVSNTQRYKMLGNGLTVDVIKHFFDNLYLLT